MIIDTKSKDMRKKKTNPSKNTTKSKNGAKKVNYSAQRTIPYQRIFKNGMIESEENYYTKAYRIEDTNFRTAAQSKQEEIFLKYESMLNTFNDSERVQIIINNKNIEEDVVLNNILIKQRSDVLSEFREEYNNIIIEKMAEGRNNLISEKYIVVGTHAPNPEQAKSDFTRIDANISDNFKAMTDAEAAAMTIDERIKVMHDICNIGNEKACPADFSIENVIKQGITSKDIIAPSGFCFDANYFKMGEVYASTLFAKVLPTSLSTEFMAEIAALPMNLTASIYYQPLRTDKAVKLLKENLININGNVIEAQKKASAAGYDASLISTDLQEAQAQTKEMLQDITKRNQKMFMTTIAVTFYAESKEKLKENSDLIIALGNRFLVAFDKLLYQQEQGFQSTLPLALNKLPMPRMLNTESASLFLPFSSQEMMQPGGIYYGLNGMSNNLLIVDRLAGKNQNELISGVPGSGKSFTAKKEIISVLLSTEDEIYIIDPENEYSILVKELKIGQVVNLAPGNGVFINPFDMDINYAKSDDGESEDPVTLKSDFIATLVETMMGVFSLTPSQKTIIDRCVRILYQPYLQHMASLADSNITNDPSFTPTLDDFYSLLMSQQEPEARNIALTLELYCKGSFNTFSSRTNVDTNSRFVVYNTKKLGTSMAEIGIQICLNHIWNKAISNYDKKLRTWFYIDEFYLLLQSENSTKFLMQIWKRARKWACLPTAITQNIGDLMRTDNALAILSNCNTIIMLSQSPADRIQLANMYSISDEQMKFISDSGVGKGLFYNGSTIVPFVDKFPKNTRLYKVMSTNPNEKIKESA